MTKGQLFLISGVIVVVVLILMKNGLNLYKLVENKNALEAGFESLEFRNIEDEILKTVQISYSQKPNISSNINNFTTFVRSSLSTRMIDLNGFFVETVYSNSTRLNVTFFNFLGKDVSFLNLTLGSSTPQLFYSTADGSSISTNFTFSGEGDYDLKVFFNTSSENRTENFTVEYESGESSFVGFFDMSFVGSRGELRDKFTEDVSLPVN
jgi:hypothetical protein